MYEILPLPLRIPRALISLGQAQILRRPPSRPKWAGEARSWNKPREECETNWRKIRQPYSISVSIYLSIYLSIHWIQQNLCSWQKNKTNVCMNLPLFSPLSSLRVWNRRDNRTIHMPRTGWTQLMDVLQWVGIAPSGFVWHQHNCLGNLLVFAHSSSVKLAGKP